MSEEDIPAGARWNPNIANHLQVAGFGIICLTPENLGEPWILFEAGALAKAIDTSFVCPYLLELEPADVPNPLGQFQAKKADKADTLDLVRSLNLKLLSLAPGAALSDTELETSFDRWWQDLEDQLQATPNPESAVPARRDQREVLDDLLTLTRQISRQLTTVASIYPTTDRALDAFRTHIRSRRAALAGFMEQGASLTLFGDMLIVIPRNDIYVRYLADNRTLLAELASEFFGYPIRAHIAPSQRTA